jgi:hypothetical protein
MLVLLIEKIKIFNLLQKYNFVICTDLFEEILLEKELQAIIKHPHLNNFKKQMNNDLTCLKRSWKSKTGGLQQSKFKLNLFNEYFKYKIVNIDNGNDKSGFVQEVEETRSENKQLKLTLQELKLTLQELKLTLQELKLTLQELKLTLQELKLTLQKLKLNL